MLLSTLALMGRMQGRAAKPTFHEIEQQPFA